MRRSLWLVNRRISFAWRAHDKRLNPADYNRAFAPFDMTRSSSLASTVLSDSRATATAISHEQGLGGLERGAVDLGAKQLLLGWRLASAKNRVELLGFCMSRLRTVKQQIKALEIEGLKQWGGSQA
ncbi:hypothetical protein ACVBEH_00300 [Roseateles sp. GG27B]